jgi:hypothetical protein
MKSRTACIVGLCLTALAGGCGSSGGARATTTTTIGQTPKELAAEKTLAETENLRLSDFPTGWTTTPNPQNNPSAPAIETELASCLHRPVAFFDHRYSATASSPQFQDAAGDEQVSSEIRYDASAALAEEQFTVLQESQFPSCFGSALDALIAFEIRHPDKTSASVPTGLTFGTSKVARTPFPSYGDRSIAYRLTLPVSDSGTTVDSYFDFVAVQQGRVAITLLCVGLGTPFDTTMEQKLTTVTVGRVVGSLANV